MSTLAVLHTPCEKCGKPTPVCVCDRIEVLPAKTRVVILQHPQEDDKVLGTAKLVALSLAGAEIRVGLSWASLAHAVGDEQVRPERWAVLAAAKLPDGTTLPTSPGAVHVVDRKGAVKAAGSGALDGLLVLDGTWSQAKTLWWRNPWLLKLGRVTLTPREPSLYGKLRKEPRREWVSTLEAIADVLPAFGEPEATRDALRKLLRTMLQRVRDAMPQQTKPERIDW